jgi:hypothetical protein
VSIEKETRNGSNSAKDAKEIGMLLYLLLPEHAHLIVLVVLY